MYIGLLYLLKLGSCYINLISFKEVVYFILDNAIIGICLSSCCAPDEF